MRVLPMLTALPLTAALLSGCTGEAEQVPSEPPVRPARIFEVTRQAVTDRLEMVGRVEAAQSVDMAFELDGRLSELPVREGQRISAGTLVAAIDPTDYELALREAEVQQRLAEQDYDRKVQLLAEQVVSQSVVDDARTLLELRQVKVAQAREALGDTRLSAPFDAYVVRRYMDNHVNVAAGTPVVRLADLRELHIKAAVPEAVLATGDASRVVSLEAVFDFAPEQRFPLTIRENTGEADSVAQTYEVTFAMPPPEGITVLPGMTATVVAVIRGTNESPIVIPTSALASDAERNFHVWLYDPAEGRVHKRYVSVGTPSGSGIPVTSGLEEGDSIVAIGASHLTDGMRVRPLGEPVSSR